MATDGTVWLSGYDMKLLHFDGSLWSEPRGFAELESVATGTELSAMAAGPDKELYLVVGATSLVEFDGSTWTETTVPAEVAAPIGDPWTEHMAVAPDGTLWAAGGDALISYRDGTWDLQTATYGIPPGDIHSLTVAPDGDVWAILHRDVGRFDGASWTVYSTGDGLHDNAPTAIAAGSDGTIWVVHGGDECGHDLSKCGVSRFDGESWTTVTIDNVGSAFGGQGAVVDDTGTLWIGTWPGVIGFDGTQATALRAGSDTRPSVEAPSTVVEGGTDILATTKAKPTPSVATCPPGSHPDEPSPVEGFRPPRQYGNAALDRQSGKVIVVSGGTWSFDLCSNT